MEQKNKDGVRFVRINGKVVPLKGNGSGIGSKKKKSAPSVEAVSEIRFKPYERDTKTRFQESGKIGAGIGAFLGLASGSNFGIKAAIGGTAAGAAAGGLLFGGLGAAFGLRKGTKMEISTKLQKKKNRTGV